MVEQLPAVNRSLRIMRSFLATVVRSIIPDQQFVDESPETFKIAHIICADGFNLPVAVNKENWGRKKMQIGGRIYVLHDLFHADGYEHCKGLKYDFTVNPCSPHKK